MRPHPLATTLLVVAGLVASAAAPPLPIILRVDIAPLAWADSRLDELLTTRLTRDPEVRVILSEPSAGHWPSFPTDKNNLDSLLDWGTEVGGRYLLTVAINREELIRQKTFSVPLIFHQWETLAVIDGEIRLLDLQKRRLLAAEPFGQRLSATRLLQSSCEDDRNDPSLHINAADKVRLFLALESRVVDTLSEKISKWTRGR